MATVKHIKIYNANYDAATDYLTMQHDEFTNKPILDENGEMMPRDFFLLEGINCDPNSFNQECQSVNARYGKNQNYGEIKAHHYIVSFDPNDRDENGLTPEKAQALGMELARKSFPGHQIIVCTHRDGHNSAGNIHCHIVINSVRKMDVAREDFMERPGDSVAGNKHHCSDHFMEFFKQSTMEMCQREHLYQVDLLTPAKVRITDREYWAQRRGQAALDRKNEELIASGELPVRTTFETEKAVLRRQIMTVLTDSHDYDEFRKKLLEQYGIEVGESRGPISYLVPDRSKPIRGRKLGTDFEKEFIENFFRQKREQAQSHSAEKDASQSIDAAARASRQPHARPQPSIRLIVDVQACIKAQENKYYAQKVKVGNLQQMAKTLAFLQENGIGTEEELASILSSTRNDQQVKHDELLAVESRLKTVNRMIRLTGQYLANKAVYKEFLNAKNKSRFREEHASEIQLYEAARKELKELSGGEKLPTMKMLREEKAELTAKKNALYEDYSTARAKYREIQTVNSNVEAMLGAKARSEERAKERS